MSLRRSAIVVYAALALQASPAQRQRLRYGVAASSGQCAAGALEELSWGPAERGLAQSEREDLNGRGFLAATGHHLGCAEDQLSTDNFGLMDEEVVGVAGSVSPLSDVLQNIVDGLEAACTQYRKNIVDDQH